MPATAKSCPTPLKRSGIRSTSVRLTLVHAVLASLAIAITALPQLFFGEISVGIVIMLAIAGLLVVSLAMARISRQLTDSINDLSDAARRIADGDLQTDIAVNCDCDVGELAGSMNTMVERLRASMAENRYLAAFDQATGLPNRHEMTARLNEQLAQGGDRAKGAILFISVLDIQRISDSLGHATGDAFLAAVANTIIQNSPPINLETNSRNALSSKGKAQPFVARFSSSEIVLLLPGHTDRQAVATITDRLHTVLSRGTETGGRRFDMRIAIGVTFYDETTKSPAEALQRGSLASAQAIIAAGPQKTCFFEDEFLNRVRKREATERDLRIAIAQDEFEIHYQPKVDATDWTLNGVEALLRWKHPVRGMVSPGEFIPVAEMTGLIGALGMIVLDKAVAQCAHWAREGHMREMSINVSLEQFRDPAFGEAVINIVQKHNCPPQLITLEITETIAATNLAMIINQIEPLRAEGIRLAIDDFGTGYSNLAQLTSLKFDVLKVDRSFVSGLETEGPAREVSKAIIQLGKNLGCRIVAEGAETPGQVAAVSTLGCDEIQGFYFSRPVSAAALEEWQEKRSEHHLKSIVEVAFGPNLEAFHNGRKAVS